MSQKKEIEITACISELYGEVLVIEFHGEQLYIAKSVIEEELKKFDNFKK